MAEVMLTCNAQKCNKKLPDEAYVTSCSHIFCKDHGQKILQNCLLCGTKLGNNFDFVLMDLKPTDQYKSIVLCGLNPEQIMDIASRAISFFTYQMSLETQIKDNILKNMKRINDENCISISSSFKAELLKTQRFADALRAELEEKMQEMEMHKQKVVSLARENKALQAKVAGYKREIIFQKGNAHGHHVNQEHIGSSSSVVQDGCDIFSPHNLNKDNFFHNY